MSCNKPLTAYQSFQKRPNGNRAITFSPDGGTHPIALPCGQCIGCRLDKARSWAMRLHLEAKDHEANCFVTLTYDEENIPHGNSLVPEDLQRFVKRLRKHIEPTRIRFYGVGEYGDKTQRPHYHLVIFGYDFPDRKRHSGSDDNVLYTSRFLRTLWPYGHSTVQDFNFATGAYVSKYAVKKITGEKAKEHYQRFDTDTGEVYELYPEFARMSRRPGIGSAWLEKYHKDIYPKGYVTNGKGVKIPPPEYFNKLFKKWYPEAFEAFREEKREENFKRYKEHNQDRAKAREIIQTQRNKQKGGKL